MSSLYTDYANGLYDPTANTLGRVDILSDTIKLALIDVLTYIVDIDADNSLDDIPGGAVIATATPTGLTVIDRAFTFDPVTFVAVVGADVEAAVLYMDTGIPTTSPLIAYIDSFASGVPFTPDGTNVTVTPDAEGLIVF